ncbi:quinone oxidoreductase [Salinisphaera orenii MK-B5]|uniref:Quinone oxidoreductase n=2 Tax=Salinisphaera orenii TaxID=856731 RepID=A0A423PMT9_9GAMM|nr:MULTISPECIES: acryloyl-CoA reductase [Salinisphaera]ROO26935.1 quinone oxidoreductase [Salinisphaera orenii MK-B5]ROO32965.1 quinone oxidoreductase [Salinisphaera halophila YIM 95161]
MKALRIVDTDDGTRGELTDVALDTLSEGDVVIKARYSSLNFKDALAITGQGKIARKRPLNAGIDVAGTVESSEDARFSPGDEVLVTGWFLSETRDGGLAEYVRVPADCVTARPEGLSLWETMAIGTAGFTAGMAIKRMRDNFQAPEQGPVVVTGATGGVGMFAIDMLAGAGYEVIAVSRKAEQHGDFLRQLGATDVIGPEALDLEGKPMGKPVYAGGIDAVGGELLANLLGHVHPYGNVAAIGLAGSPKLPTMVLPFILRGVSLLGIHSVECPPAWREQIWAAMAGADKPSHLDSIATQTVGLRDVFDVCEAIMAGRNTGRTVVDIQA